MMTTRRSTCVALLAAGLLAAGCGGGGDDDDGVASLTEGDGESAAGDTAGDQDAELFEWAECMRDEGIEMEDPVRDSDGNLSIEGPGIRIGTGGDDAGPQQSDRPDEEDDDLPNREVMDAAQEACGDPPLMGPRNLSEEDRQAMEDAALEFAECMREEGVTDFPDPDFSDSGPGGQAATSESESGAEGGEGPQEHFVVGPFGEIDLDDPTTAAAFEACQDLMGPPPGEGDGPGAPAGEGGDA